MNLHRCKWAGTDPAYIKYHDREWGVPVYNDRRLFEFLVLEGAQAGLSWLTVLKKREGYRKAFNGFNVKKVARYGRKKIASLLRNPRIIRNRLKIKSAVSNAKAFLQIQKEFGSFSRYQWKFVGGKPLQNHRQSMRQIPARTRTSDAFSKDLKRRGLTFVGSTIIYAHMQAAGMVNDHTVNCFRHRQVKKAQRRL